MRIPSPKRQRLVQGIVENLKAKKPKSVRNLMREAGYSEAQATQPQQITQSASFIQLLERYLPDGFILDNLHDLISQKRNEVARSKGIDIAVRLKGQYA